MEINQRLFNLWKFRIVDEIFPDFSSYIWIFNEKNFYEDSSILWIQRYPSKTDIEVDFSICVFTTAINFETFRWDKKNDCFRDKAANAKKERYALKEQIKQQQKLIKDEKKKYKGLQKEVDKMAKLMGDTDDEDAEDEEDEDEEEEEESESEDESESEESEEEESESDDEDAEPEERKTNLQVNFSIFQSINRWISNRIPSFLEYLFAKNINSPLIHRKFHISKKCKIPKL